MSVGGAGSSAIAGGRAEQRTRAAVERFNAAFNRHDVDAVMAAMTEDCVFEDTTAPDGGRYEGAVAVRHCWERLFASSPEAVFETEEMIVAGDRAIVRWRYRWGDGDADHVRGVDVLRARGDRIAEKLSYVKG